MLPHRLRPLPEGAPPSAGPQTKRNYTSMITGKIIGLRL